MKKNKKRAPKSDDFEEQVLRFQLAQSEQTESFEEREQLQQHFSLLDTSSNRQPARESQLVSIQSAIATVLPKIDHLRNDLSLILLCQPNILKSRVF